MPCMKYMPYSVYYNKIILAERIDTTQEEHVLSKVDGIRLNQETMQRMGDPEYSRVMRNHLDLHREDQKDWPESSHNTIDDITEALQTAFQLNLVDMQEILLHYTERFLENASFGVAYIS